MISEDNALKFHIATFNCSIVHHAQHHEGFCRMNYTLCTATISHTLICFACSKVEAELVFTSCVRKVQQNVLC